MFEIFEKHLFLIKQRELYFVVRTWLTLLPFKQICDNYIVRPHVKTEARLNIAWERHQSNMLSKK